MYFFQVSSSIIYYTTFELVEAVEENGISDIVAAMLTNALCTGNKIHDHMKGWLGNQH